MEPAPATRLPDGPKRAMAAAVHHAEVVVEGLPQRLARFLHPKAPRVACFIACVDIDSPLILCFALVCVVVHALDSVFTGLSASYFAIGPLSTFAWMSPLSYMRMLSHVFGHTSWQHLNGNMVNLILVGPNCEREFGASNLLDIMTWTGIVSGVAHMFLGPANAFQLGASGVVFMLILLNSLVETKAGRIPLTFLVQVSLWCSSEVFSQLFSSGGGVSHVAHLAGAVVGTVAGYQLHGEKVRRRAEGAAMDWLAKARTRLGTTPKAPVY